MQPLLSRNLQRLPAVCSSVARRTQCYAPPKCSSLRHFHSTPVSHRVIPYILADIGEGITECQVISWSVKPGDQVQQFDNICEVQSDKASVEITSRFDGTIKALHYEASDMAVVGQPLLDIDVDDNVLDELNPVAQQPIGDEAKELEPPLLAASKEPVQELKTSEIDTQSNEVSILPFSDARDSANKSHLVTPAVRHMLKTHSIDIGHVSGTGKDGRILKEDVQRHISVLSSSPPSSNEPSSQVAAADRLVTLSPIETQMFKVMTRSLEIPHFLYSHTVDFTSLGVLRKRLNGTKTSPPVVLETNEQPPKFTPLPFILKALSLAFVQFPQFNSSLDTRTTPEKPSWIHKASHNFGIAVDTPQGLLVPVVRDVQDRSVASIAREIRRISSLAKDGKLSPADFKGATFTVSNIGSIGGSVVGPVIVEPMVGIVGVGQVRAVPVFRTGDDGVERVVKREEVVLSWSADHRVIDGASVARCAKTVQELLENFELTSTTLK